VVVPFSSWGIQLAGPHRTAATLLDVLQRTSFFAPYALLEAGGAGFERPADSTLTDDVADVYWSNRATSPCPNDHPGVYCWVAARRRRSSGQWPKKHEPCNGICDTGSKQVP